MDQRIDEPVVILRQIFELTEPADMPHRVELCQRALALVGRDQDPMLWAELQVQLGTSLARNLQGDPAENLEQAIAAFEQGREVLTRGATPVKWATVTNYLANAYAERVRDNRADNLERAIYDYQQALEELPRDMTPALWAQTMHNLAAAYADRLRGDRADNLEQAIQFYRQALEVRTRETMPDKWAQTLNNLANAYGDRIRGERADNLERAISAYEQALEVRMRETMPASWAQTLHNLAGAYTVRRRGDRADNLERAIQYYQEALEVRTREAMPAKWAQTLHSLAAAYVDRVDGDHGENIEQAIVHYRRALEVRTPEAGSVNWATTVLSLGAAYFHRACGERAQNIEEAITCYKQALHVFSRDDFPEQWASLQHNLGLAYAEWVCGQQHGNYEQARLHYARALEIYTLEAFPANHRLTLQSMGDLYFDELNWRAAVEAYQGAIHAGDLLLAAAYTTAGRQAEVGATAHLHARTAYSLLRLGRPDEALLWLEQGKTRLLNETLALGAVDLAALPDDQRRSLAEALQAIRELEAEVMLPPDTPARRSDAVLHGRLRQARAALDQVVEAIRTRHPDFMPRGLDLPDILALVPPAGALVAPLVTTRGGAVFVIPDSTEMVTAEHVVWLDALTDRALLALVVGAPDEPSLGGWMGAYAPGHNLPPSAAYAAWLADWQASLETFSRRLWDLLMGPVHARLELLGRKEGSPIVLLPQGGLGLLPLHAAWREIEGTRRAFLDDYTVSFAPSTYVLSISRRRQRQTTDRSLLAVINPTRDLPYAAIEGEAVAACFTPATRRVLTEGEATEEAVVSAARGRTYLHFACHGVYDWHDVMCSALLLAEGEPFTLGAILSPRFDLSGTCLVTLSACETGVAGLEVSADEYLGLPAGMLQAGTPAVISTLWAVGDVSTALLMKEFYRRHVGDDQTPAAALRGAQLWLRDATAQQLALSELWGAMYEASGRRDKTAFVAMRYYRAHPGEQPFAHPYFWAAFLASGVV